MKNVYKQKRQQGFTIIEVLIVLAIAALILLIVFLAVPALQRSSRNNSTRQEAADVLAAVNDYVANNNGSSPNKVTCVNGQVTVSNTGGGNASETRVRGGTSCSEGTNVYPADPGVIVIGIGFKCDAGTPGGTPISSNRSFSALFKVETGSSSTSTANQCLDG
jgi:prepilin-type N-terminal cleavage/methylation domain-containing protein